MRMHWKLLSGLGIAGAALGLLIVGSRDVAGDTTADSSTQATSPGTHEPAEHEPFTPYDMGPAAIPYESQSAKERANIDRMRARTETDQPPESIDAFARASAESAQAAELEITTRQLGLVGVDEQGVVP